MTAAEIQAVDIGTPAGPEFRGERIATLDEFLAATKGRIGLNIELQYYGHDQDLVNRVICRGTGARREGGDRGPSRPSRCAARGNSCRHRSGS